jgi:NAD-dependent SIR2 family protein deacetylase
VIDTSSLSTVKALRRLEETIRSGKPPVFWVGAGISTFCGYPLWWELGESFHKSFMMREPDYDSQLGASLLARSAYPAFFSLCRTVSSREYARLLVGEFSPRPATPEYERFLDAIRGYQPIQIVTTNIDERIEQHLPECSIVQRPDIARIVDLLTYRAPFIAKLHGSVSQIAGTVFTTEDYEELLADQAYQYVLSDLFMRTCVVFLGTSLSDEYILRLLQTSDRHKGIFGDGPHFLISDRAQYSVPASVRIIQYERSSSSGHRALLQTIEHVAPAGCNQTTDVASPVDINSMYLLTAVRLKFFEN